MKTLALTIKRISQSEIDVITAAIVIIGYTIINWSRVLEGMQAGLIEFRF